jgi:hypothetical protein
MAHQSDAPLMRQWRIWLICASKDMDSRTEQIEEQWRIG